MSLISTSFKSVSLETIVDENGKMSSFTTASRDITDLKEVEIRLNDSDQRFQSIANNIPGVVYLCNNDDSFSMFYLNNEVETLTGYQKRSPEAVI